MFDEEEFDFIGFTPKYRSVLELIIIGITHLWDNIKKRNVR